MKNLKENLLPTFNQYTLPNGMRIIHEPSASKVAYCGFAVDAGTRDELENEQGMAHFVEHLIFKGTKKRKAWHILNRMENVGGDLNAYTNKEETVIYSAFLTEHFGRAFELLTDIVFHSTFPQREIEKETEVIIDEIQSYEDNPSELIFDDFEDLIFREHPLGRNILGNPEQLKKFRSEDAAAFTSRFYHPGNMVFFVLGNMDFRQVVRWAEKLLADIPAEAVDNRRTPPPLYVPKNLVLHKDTHQAHIMIGSRGYNAYEDKRTALYLLLFALWGFSLDRRIIQRQALHCLRLTAALILLWLILRTLKYSVVTGLTAARYVWYLYYLPMLFLPLLGVYIALSMGKPEDYRLSRRSGMLLIVPAVLFLLVITNDLHQQVFAFKSGVPGLPVSGTYSHRPLYYVCLGWIVGCMVFSLVCLFRKSRMPGGRGKRIIPFVLGCVMFLYGLLYLSGIPAVRWWLGDMNVMFCLLYAAIYESCIRCRMIPSNTGYMELFEASTLAT